MIQYKRYDATNLDALWQLFQSVNTEGHDLTFKSCVDKAMLAAWTAEVHQHYYVAECGDSGEVLGVVRALQGDSPQKSHAVYLTAAVSAQHRGQRIAPALTDYALEDLKGRGIKIARIYVYSDNAASVMAVEKLGFVRSGEVKMHHFDADSGQFVDDLIYHKLLLK
ncbi:N-acetyltransferase family protein [Fusibacter sp. JL298sf-3]